MLHQQSFGPKTGLMPKFSNKLFPECFYCQTFLFEVVETKVFHFINITLASWYFILSTLPWYDDITFVILYLPKQSGLGGLVGLWAANSSAALEYDHGGSNPDWGMVLAIMLRSV